jgi:hypothetical protein
MLPDAAGPLLVVVSPALAAAGWDTSMLLTQGDPCTSLSVNISWVSESDE